MREGWTRTAPDIDLDPAAAAALIQPVFPGASVDGVHRMTSGLANASFRVAVAGRDRPVLLRLFLRDPESAPKEAAIAERLAGQIPVARFLHLAPSNPATGHPYAVLEWVDGARLETAVEGASDVGLMALGRSVGAVLADIGGTTFPRPGFLDAQLGIARVYRLDGPGYLAFVSDTLGNPPVRERLGDDLTDRFQAFARQNATRLDALDPTARLVHSDFGGANILVTSDAGHWAVSAVLDWEFAFAGPQIVDVGNLSRAQRGLRPAFESGFSQGFIDHGGVLPDDWRRLARLVDLLAWLDFLDRPEPGAGRIADAQATFTATMRDWDSLG